MKIGLYFGTFNPIHIGHLIIANHFVEHTDLDQIWMVVTPHNPHKNKKSLLDGYHRLQMVYLATENYHQIKPSDVEFKLPQPNYTINTLVHLFEKYPNYQFSLIMGQDNLNSFHKWKNYESILQNNEIYVYPRLSFDQYDDALTNLNMFKEKIHFVNAPIIELSSTFIRENIKNGKNIVPMLPSKVWDYVAHNNFYKK
ncbi:MAG TPA: nicotinic acid mononucleotide adenylyltransferase [Flavobacterium sp.]|nr:nicotinic acid mononucleotide adenylyltransferase [Flavobacterium sp.]